MPADLDQQVLDTVLRDPTISVRRICRQVGILRTTVWRILKHDSYHYRKGQGLFDYARLVYSTWI